MIFETQVSNNNIFRLKNFFGEIFFDNKQIVSRSLVTTSAKPDLMKSQLEQITEKHLVFDLSHRKKDVLLHLKTMNTSKPLGPTDIPAWAIKDGRDVLMHHLTYLFNAFLKQGTFPSDLKKAIITTLF